MVGPRKGQGLCIVAYGYGAHSLQAGSRHMPDSVGAATPNADNGNGGAAECRGRYFTGMQVHILLQEQYLPVGTVLRVHVRTGWL